jgi:hypothetical protein
LTKNSRHENQQGAHPNGADVISGNDGSADIACCGFIATMA